MTAAESLAVACLQKARRGKAPRHIVIRVNGLMCRIEDIRGEWVYHERGKKIVTQDELSRIDGDTTGRFHNGKPIRRLNTESMKLQRDAMVE